ncbi:hypothetical protein PMAYCL1PPCAC_17533, partial [Pristionchus mayeri]
EHTSEATNGLSSVDVEDVGFVIPLENAEHTTDDEMVEEARSKTSDASGNDSLLSPTRSRTHDSDSNRKFRITGLKHPGEWRKHEKLQEMLARCEQFHVWFDPNPMRGVKTGGISVTFDCPEAARIAFGEAQKFIIDGAPVKMLASRSFYLPSRRPLHSFTVSEDAEVRDRTVYAVYLLESTSEEVLKGIFGESMERVEIIPLSENRKQAEIVMTTKEAAVTAMEDADGFDLADGENISVLKMFTPSEYSDFVTRSSRPPLLSPTLSTSSSLIAPISRSNSTASTSSKPSPTKAHQKEVEKSPVKPTAAPAPLPTEIPDCEPSLSEVAASITGVVEEERCNWAEINEREELYTLVDKASYKLGGVRDDLLRDSLLAVMEGARAKAAAEEASWMRRHLDTLIKMWKKEISSGVPFERPTRVPLQARVINPVPQDKKRKKGGGAALRAKMGVGEILAAARSKFATEEGELDIEEGDDGSILIGDVPLSFESWARFNKQPLKRPAPKEEKSSVESPKDNRRVKRLKMEEEKKKKKEAKKEAEKPQKELEEGEMDSDSEGDKKGSSSSSSSSSSDSDEEGDSRRRRRFRRKNDRNKPPTLPPLFQSIYDNRVAIISQLSIEHRVAFSKVLTQFVNQKGGIDSNQQKALMSYMSTFQK